MVYHQCGRPVLRHEPCCGKGERPRPYQDPALVAMQDKANAELQAVLDKLCYLSPHDSEAWLWARLHREDPGTCAEKFERMTGI